jgi:hypothetical protein
VRHSGNARTADRPSRGDPFDSAAFNLRDTLK